MTGDGREPAREEDTTALLELTVGAVAAGGACVAREADGRVVFVRHVLPGERVRARLTSAGARFARADAIEILDASPDRVPPPCPHAGPGRCGGCDFQHVSLEGQRRLKSRLVAEALRRIGHLDHIGDAGELAIEIEGVEGAADGLGWRTRVRFAVDGEGRPGFRRHRSHDIEAVRRCPIALPGIEDLGLETMSWPPASAVEVLASPSTGDLVVSVSTGQRRGRRASPAQLPALPDDVGIVVDNRTVRRPPKVRFEVLGRRYAVSAEVFWQVHTTAASVLAEAVLDAVGPRPGEHAADLYAGAGLFAGVLGAAVGRSGSITAVERDERACADAIANLADLPQVSVVRRSVTPALISKGLGRPAIVVLDPAREGAGSPVCTALASLDPAPRVIAYVSCDPASFARDVATMCALGWSLTSLRGFDLFPMTEHVELVGVLAPPAG